VDTQTLIYALTAIVLAGQLWVFERQRQLLQMELDWRRGEAIARFYQLCIRLASNFGRADGGGTLHTTVPIDQSFDADLLPEMSSAATRFAPLGPRAVRHLITGSFLLGQYVRELQGLALVSKGDEQRVLLNLKLTRELVGRQLDHVAAEIPSALRWSHHGDRPFNFQKLCSDGGTRGGAV